MKITSNDILLMVEGVLKNLLEYHSVIEKRYEEIAKSAIDNLNNGKTNFKIDEISFTYSKLPKEKIATYNKATKTISFDDRLMCSSDDFKLTVFMHELCHHVNFENGYGKAIPFVDIKTESGKVAKEISYLFSETEVNARLTQLYYAIRGEKNVSLERAENLALIPKMKRALNKLEADSYVDYYEDVDKYAENSIVVILYAIECEKKGKPEFPLSENDFHLIKNRYLKYYMDIFRNYINKVHKIFFDYAGT